MSEFKVGDRVHVPKDCDGILPEFRGEDGTVTDVGETYIHVRFDNVDAPRGKTDSWMVDPGHVVKILPPVDVSSIANVEAFLNDQ